MSVADAIGGVAVFTVVDIDEEGKSELRSGAEVPEVEGECLPDDGVAEAECKSDDLPLMDGEVERFLFDADNGDALLVSLFVGQDGTVETFSTAWAEANLASIGGTAPEPGDVRRQVADGLREARAGDLKLVAAAVEAAGGEVIETADLSGTIDAMLTSSQLAEIVILPEVEAVQTIAQKTKDGYWWLAPGWSAGGKLTGEEVEEIIQSRVLYRHTTGPYLGATVGLGLTESGGDSLYLSRFGWNDATGTSRVSNCDWDSWTSSCSPNSPASGDEHATAVASLMVGDLTLGQDPTITTTYPQRQRSGVARASTLVGMDTSSRAAVESWATTVFQGSIINQSAHALENCSGNTDWARTVNAIFESGIAWFNSMGNDGHASLTTCNAGGESSALGGFAVSGSTWPSGSNTNEIFGANSRGGVGSSPANGRNRAIVGLTAPTNIEFPYSFSFWVVDCAGAPLTYGTDWTGTPHPEGCGPEALGATSGAAPIISGAAAIYKDYFLDAFNTYIEDPGALYTNLLLMGDRAQTLGVNDQFDNLWGAGMLRLRAGDSLGLDNPAGWGTGNVCVGSGATVTLPAAASPYDGQPLSAASDYLRVVAWWYDRRVDDGIFSHDQDHVDMRLVRTGSTSETYNSTLDDNRQRQTVTSSVGGSSFEIKFIGRDVTADGEGCGNNSMKVYWAWMYEDSARDDVELDLDGVSVMTYTRVEQ